MTRLQRIEREIKALNEDEFMALAAWIDELRADLWDKQIKLDAEAGKLDKLAAKALADHKAGRTRPL